MNQLNWPVLITLPMNKMTQRTFTGKTGDVWTWEETPETIEALKKLHETVKKVNEQQTTND